MNCSVMPDTRHIQPVRSDRTRNIRTMIDYFTAWNEHDADALLATFAPDAVYQDPNWRGPVGSDSFRRYVTRLWAAFPDLHNHVESLDQYEADRAIGQWTLQGTNTGPFLGLKASQRSVRLGGADMFAFEAGKILSVVSHFDGLELARQIGLEVIVRQPEEGRQFSSAVMALPPSERPRPRRANTGARPRLRLVKGDK